MHRVRRERIGTWLFVGIGPIFCYVVRSKRRDEERWTRDEKVILVPSIFLRHSLTLICQ